MDRARLSRALADLDGWFETMRQAGGYGGPVVHWWNHRLRYTGPGQDWRYEGVLIGYALLARRLGDPWRGRVDVAVRDLLRAQLDNGHFPASRFEGNPGSLGTPHEAAASLGLLAAADLLDKGEEAASAARRSLDGLIEALWVEDARAFVDVPGRPGIVPNKSATMALALLELARSTGEEAYAQRARSALRAVMRYLVLQGPHRGAVHQLASNARDGDGRFFPYYIARCVGPLIRGAELLDEDDLASAAHDMLDFLERRMAPDGSWPQLLYQGGGVVESPRWVAAVGDVLTAFLAARRTPPPAAVERLLASQTPMGSFPAAEGFGAGPRARDRSPLDLMPVAGWNDKVLRFLASSLEGDGALPASRIAPWCVEVVHLGRSGRFVEDAESVEIAWQDGGTAFRWRKSEPWARHVDASLEAW